MSDVLCDVLYVLGLTLTLPLPPQSPEGTKARRQELLTRTDQYGKTLLHLAVEAVAKHHRYYPNANPNPDPDPNLNPHPHPHSN